jgi:pSer/pThr/pTyr-binding forkhead associated (FHA) protein
VAGGRKAEFVIVDGLEKGRVLPLRPHKPIELGREGNFRLEDPALSRHHCSIEYINGAYHLTDKGSSWGTYVNDVKISNHVLNDNDRVRVGNHTMLFHLGEMMSEAPAAPYVPTPRAPIVVPDEPLVVLEEEELIAEEDSLADPTLTPGAVNGSDIPAAPVSGAFEKKDLFQDEAAQAEAAAPLAAAPAAAAAAPAAEPAGGPDNVPIPGLDVPPPEPDVKNPLPGVCWNCEEDIPADNLDKTVVADDLPSMDEPTYCSGCRDRYPQLGETLANHVCEKVLGAGGMGVVFRAKHKFLGRYTAVKTLKGLGQGDPTLVQRLLREATAGGRIQHPAIVSVADTGEENETAYVVMEYVQGEDLSEALKREEKFSIKRATAFTLQVCDALVAAFKLGYIHRDIKPENVLLMKGDHVKVTDFGLAKNLKEGELSGLTRTGQVLGTMVYIAPEMIIDSKAGDQRADIYSLGTTYFQLMTGRPPFDTKSAVQLLMQIRKEQPPKLRSLVPDAPESIERIIDKCLMKAPEDRYQTPDELLVDLKKAWVEIT